MFKNFLFIMSILSSILGCKTHKELKTVENIDLNKYLGKWYEIAAFPQSFEKGCNCTTAEYSLSPNVFVVVKNTCRKGSVIGPISQAIGKAFIDKDNKAKLKVQFFWPFTGKYWIIDLANDYSFAVVGHPNRKYLWILCRTPKMDKAIYDGILERLKQNDFDISKLVITAQQ